MKKFLLIIFCVTLLSSCGNSAYVDACKEIIKEQLKDPYSVQWESVEEITEP